MYTFFSIKCQRHLSDSQKLRISIAGYHRINLNFILHERYLKKKITQSLCDYESSFFKSTVFNSLTCFSLQRLIELIIFLQHVKYHLYNMVPKLNTILWVFCSANKASLSLPSFLGALHLLMKPKHSTVSISWTVAGSVARHCSTQKRIRTQESGVAVQPTELFASLARCMARVREVQSC